jgi:hypothetical protein
MTDKPIVILRNADGSVVKQVAIKTDLYVPPKIVIDGAAYYLRTSPDNIHSPLEFVRVMDVYVLDVPR